jgi:hypothetical protein
MEENLITSSDPNFIRQMAGNPDIESCILFLLPLMDISSPREKPAF